MRCLLTGYAVSFNRRHRRCGHLLQNRYKSILCQEDSYLLELVRYIHLNPLRAKLVASLSELDEYPYSGHSALLNRYPKDWQDVDAVLKRFGDRKSPARKTYREFVAKGAEMRRQPNLTGGGLVRSLGGWDEVKRRRNAGDWGNSDERILGDSDFVQAALAAGLERLAMKYRYRSDGWDFDRLVMRVSEVLKIDSVRVTQKGRYPDVVAARSLLCYWGHRELGISTVELARRLRLTQPAISQSVARGSAIAVSEGLVLATM